MLKGSELVWGPEQRCRENPGALSSLGIASVAGSINVCLTIPIWTVVTRMQAAGPSKYCLPRHRMPFNSRNAGSKRVSMAWRANYAMPVGGLAWQILLATS